MGDARAKCPECTSQRIWKDGLRYTRNGEIQRYICRQCGYRFSQTFPNNTNQSNKPDHDQTVHTNKSYTIRNYNINRRVSVALAEGTKNLVKVESRIEKRAAGATKRSEVDFKSRIVEYIWMLKKQGYPGTTVRKYGWLIRRLRNCGADLLDPEDVKRVIASHDNWSNSYKEQFVCAYDHWVKMLGLTWEKPHYTHEEKLPLIPTEHDIDQLIAGCGRKVATFLQLLKETGMRYREAWLLKWADIDFARETVNVVSVKKGKPRQLKISRKLMGMLNLLGKKSEKVFGDICYGAMGTNLLRQRKTIATKLQNPRILQITPHKLRHWKASMEYHRTNNLLYVKEILGHRSILSTMIYTHLIEEPQNDEYTSRVTRSVEGARSLVEAGFEYVKEWPDGLMLFRKRK